MRHDTFIEELPCKLTPQQLLDRSRSMAATMRKLDEHEAHATQVKNELKAKAEAHKAEIQRLARIVDSGTEDRAVDCSELCDDRRFEVFTLRHDTSEEVDGSRRPMTQDERDMAVQGDLFSVRQDVARAHREAMQTQREERVELSAPTLHREPVVFDEEAGDRLREARARDAAEIEASDPYEEEDDELGVQESEHDDHKSEQEPPERTRRREKRRAAAERRVSAPAMGTETTPNPMPKAAQIGPTTEDEKNWAKNRESST